MDQRCHTLCGGTDIPDVLLRILVAQRIFMAILMIFCPIMFALSLAPPWNSAWSQWMSKFLSLSLWGFVTYMCIYYIDFILLYTCSRTWWLITTCFTVR